MWLGVLLGLLTSASWAVANVFIKRSGQAIGPIRALLWSQLIGGPALLVPALLLDHPSGVVTATTLAWAAGASVSAVLAYACLFYGLERGRLTVVVPVMSSWSVVAAAISIGFFGQKMRVAQVVGAALAVIGVVVVSRFSGGDAARRTSSAPSGLLPAVGAALGFGVLIPAIERLAPVAGRLGAIPLVFLLEMVVGVPLALLARVSLAPPPKSAWPTVAAAGLAETVGFVCISVGVAHAPIAVVSPLASVSSALTVIYAWAVLRERPSAAVIVGAALVCAGVVTLSL